MGLLSETLLKIFINLFYVKVLSIFVYIWTAKNKMPEDHLEDTHFFITRNFGLFPTHDQVLPKIKSVKSFFNLNVR